MRHQNSDMFDFTQKKFESLPLKRQHKKCAEYLRYIYDHSDLSLELNSYNEMLQWMGENPIHTINHEIVADRYHWHLKHADISKKEHHLLPLIRTGDKEQSEAKELPIAIYLDNIRSAHNIGSMIRTTEALKLGKLYFSKATPYIDHKQVQDTSMGTYEWVSCNREIPLEELPRPIIALETAENAISLYNFLFPPSFTLVVGNEEYGCSESTLKMADYIVEIPLRGRKNSLNVANALALVAGEILRQHKVRYEKK